jgi:hypothetical protein
LKFPDVHKKTCVREGVEIERKEVDGWGKERGFLPELDRYDDSSQDEQRGDGHCDVELRVHWRTHTHRGVTFHMVGNQNNRRNNQISTTEENQGHVH